MEGAIALTLSIFCVALTSVIFLILALFGRESDYNNWYNAMMQAYGYTPMWYDWRTNKWYYRRPKK